METITDLWVKIAYYISLRYLLIAGGAYFVFYILFKKQFFQRKIQLILPKNKRVLMEVLYSMQTTIIFASIFLLVMVVFRPHTNLYKDITEYGIGYYIFTIPVMFIIHDTYFYWMHRAIHHPKLFKHIHFVHHQSTNPTPLAAYSFHFSESILEALIIPIIAFTLPVHPTALILFLLGQFIINVYGHLGFELFPSNFQKTWIGRWINTSVAHNQHHKYFKGNYGLYFLFWDRWMGTLRTDYDEAFDELKNRKKHAHGELQGNQ
ncbi:sterol desaturase family protein [Fluviicola taffensis]|uniref:Fatty acid hydroxylase n=1 Tax=Fluviicola taffensis (strain DSM 16823 / NCIMB 13979 / RW262) TaxID=755732 RepID=F2IH89_FLUTR|nr:sterol desaturase family protein [Fluviicola taffensis]AEA42644.1 fatty acid hydroxylase [Fluviicola taffensis DSM 16823]